MERARSRGTFLLFVFAGLTACGGDDARDGGGEIARDAAHLDGASIDGSLAGGDVGLGFDARIDDPRADASHVDGGDDATAVTPDASDREPIDDGGALVDVSSDGSFADVPARDGGARTSLCPARCSALEGPGLSVGRTGDIYDLDRIRAVRGIAGSPTYTCRSDMPAPYVLDPPVGSRPYEDRARFETFITPYYDYIFRLSTITDTALVRTSNVAPVARCALTWIHAWMTSGVLDGAAGGYVSPEGDYQRMWATAGIVMAYARIQHEPGLDANMKAEIEAGIRRASTQVAAFTERQLSTFTNPENNILFWSGFELMAAGLVLGHEPFVTRAIELYDIGLGQIRADGLLPIELARGENAFWYHNFATRALVLTAELGATSGRDLYRRRSGRLGLLTDRVAGALVDFTTFPGHATQGSSSTASYLLDDNTRQLDWLEAHYARFGGATRSPLLRRARTQGAAMDRVKASRETGGTSTLAFGVSCFCEPA